MDVSLREAYRDAGITRMTYWFHSRRRHEPSAETALRVRNSIMSLAEAKNQRHDIWDQRARKDLIRIRHIRGLSQGDVEDAIGVTGCIVGKWEVGMRTPNGYLMACWAQGIRAQIRVIPDEVAHAVDALLEAFYETP